ncbi:MAG: nucleotidyltransferase family protein [Candidatus Eremiobacteraeota bacterium]|nr:nucleotidyltransferase family protein [Candidatus Eremiobacteraeota bacterium]
MAMQADSIIIAGGGLGAQFGESCKGVTSRALLPIHGAPMVSYIIRALRECRSIGKIALVGPECFTQLHCSKDVDFLLPEGKDETENILKGIDALQQSERILMITSDLPLVTGAMLEEFISSCPDGIDICYPFVEKKDIEKKFPARKWIYVRLKEGRFTGSSMFLFKRSTIREKWQNLKMVMESRRSVFRLASLWGWEILSGILLGTLTIGRVENKISALLKCRCRGIISSHPEIAMDVDKPSDIDLVEKIL